jgi:transposase
MALTMTRTRTQTALTRLVETLANLKGELAFVEEWLAEPGAPAELVARRDALVQQLTALETTLRMFDPELDTGGVAASEGWTRAFGRKSLSTNAVRRRYLQKAASDASTVTGTR